MTSNRDIFDNNTDFYTANSDFDRITLNNDRHELVHFHSGTTVRIWYNQEQEAFPLHWHNALEIIMPLQNCYYADVNEITYCIQESDIFLIPPGELHTVYPSSDGGTRFIFQFDIRMFTGLKGFACIQPLLTTPIQLSKEKHPDIYDNIRDILVQIQREYFEQNVFSELSIYSLLLDLFVKLGENYNHTRLHFSDAHSPKQQQEYLKNFTELLSYIDTHYMDNLTLDNMSCKMGFSKFHFSRLFKQYTNYTFCDYLNYRRIKAAEELLSNPSRSITDIAMEAGFTSISTFNRLFLKYKKCSPSEYRAKKSAFSQESGKEMPVN